MDTAYFYEVRCSMEFGKVKLFNKENKIKIKLSQISWDELFDDKSILFNAICDLILDEKNLLYYATQKESTKNLVDTRNYVDSLIKNNNLIYAIDDVFNALGWNDEINIGNTRFQGDLAEYLMSILLDKFTNVETLISKISFKTSSKMSVYGNDNVYFDYENDILYFGESKFYQEANKGLDEALKSIENHSTIEEISFVREHTSSFIAENGEKRIKVVEKYENAYIDNLNIRSIIFIMNQDLYKRESYEEMLIDYFKDRESLQQKTEEIILVFLPILSKKEFLEFFVRRVNNG